MTAVSILMALTSSAQLPQILYHDSSSRTPHTNGLLMSNMDRLQQLDVPSPSQGIKRSATPQRLYKASFLNSHEFDGHDHYLNPG